MNDLERENNIYAKLNAVRYTLSKELNKSGKNTYSKYDYFQLKDFMPRAIEECNNCGLFTKFWINKEKVELPSKKVTQYSFDTEGNKIGEIITEEENFQYVEYAYLLVIDLDDGTECLFKKETKEVALQAAQPIQNLGGKSTYMKRYMYIDVFEINENDKVEEQTGAPVKAEVKEVKPSKKITIKEAVPKKATPVELPKEEKTETTEEVVNTEDLMSMETKIQLASIIKEKGMDPRTEILEIAKELGTDVPLLKESDKPKILEIIERKVGE